MKFKTNYNAHEFPKTYEENYLPSKTIPDQSMSVKEIMTRYAQGLPLEGQRVPQYEGTDDFDDSMPDLNTLDLSERMELLEASRQNRAELERKYAQQQEEARRRKETRLKRKTPEDIEFEEFEQAVNDDANSNQDKSKRTGSKQKQKPDNEKPNQ